jgi:cytochrome c oxidase assembly protein subunit 11
VSRRTNAAFGIALACVVAGMVGASFAAVPLYRVFCAVTGYGGTPVIGGAAAPGASTEAGRPAPVIAVRLNADTNPNLPWDFRPEQNEVRLKLGDEAIAFYQARNLATTPVTGIALYNVTPEKVGKYFHKTACFCFNRQTLNPGQEMQFPVTFWVDPAIATDPSTSDVHVITLSYTFFRTLEDAAKSGALAKAGPHIGAYTGEKTSITR